jgi:outer membrane protein OmpA-like peptidoglycan-associated protein
LHPRSVAAIGVILCCLVALSAAAQERGFRLHRDEGTAAGTTTFLVERPWYSATRFAAVGLTLEYSHRALIPAVETGRGQRLPIVEHALLGHVDLAGSLFDRLQLSASLPIALLERGTPELVSGVGPLTAVAVGDPRVGARFRLFGQPERDFFSLHLGADLWIPIGAAGTHQGDCTVRFRPSAQLAGAFLGAGRWGLDLAFLYRPYASYGPPALGMTAASELQAGLSAGASLFGDRLYLGPEAKLSMQVLGEHAFSPLGTSLELLGGASLLLFDQVTVGVAGGTAFFNAAGTPDARVMLRVAWAPRRDSDGDGTPNLDDACPDAAGKGADGCPVAAADDADQDGVSDADDRCPFEPETKNGVRDADGCPEAALEPGSPLLRVLVPKKAPADAGLPPAAVGRPDAGQAAPGLDGWIDSTGDRALAFATSDVDGDGAPDAADRCPITPEDLDGYEDEDGCPEPDNDGDGLLDGVDRCPQEAETFNGEQDEDGCPDVAPDADDDGVADAVDRCPFEPENRDGLRDDDGCPEHPVAAQAALARMLAPLAPAFTQADAGVEAPRDADRDSVPDEADRCPVTAEDPDGFEDEDGCPELDDDGDGLADAKDKCPQAAETQNGWQDDDGCPDEHPDADGDGVPYDRDRCPLEPAATPDGCPHATLPALALPGFPGAPAAGSGALTTAADFDRDGTPDDADRCPVTPEDKDGFEDEDGCPELDNDRDGLEDKADRCPLEAEVINGVKDDDGCPDTGAGVVTVTKTAVLIDGRVQFKPGSATLQPDAFGLLKQVASTLRANPSLSIEIQGHTDDVGSAATNIALSKKRAETIRAFLVKQKVPASRLVAQGYGPLKPRATNKTAAGREQNRRVEFLILGEAK